MSTENPLPPWRRRRGRRRRRRMIFWGLLLVFLAGIILAAKPAYRWTKSRRALYFVGQAEALLAAGQPTEAASKYRAALQLDPLGYRPLAGAARLATRFGRPEAADLWHEVMRLPQITDADRQEYAALLLDRGKPALAEKIIAGLLQSAPDAKTLRLAALYSIRIGNDAKAAQFARLAVARASPDEHAPRFLLAEVLSRSSNPEERAEARETLWGIAEQESAAGTAALEALARVPESPAAEKSRVLAGLERIPEPGVVLDLLAAELRRQLHPEEQDRIYDEKIARWRQGEVAEVAHLARWLNLNHEFERVLALLPLERALGSESHLLSHLDALAGLLRWDEIDAALARPELRLDPTVTESFRARTALGRQLPLDAGQHWDRAIALAAGDPGKLRFVATFAEKNRASTAALKAYEQLARSPEDAVFAQRGQQRLLEESGDTRIARTAAERLRALSPDDPNAQAQLAHLNLLLGLEIEANAATAQALATKYPDRLSFRVTAALGHLRQFNPAAALAQFQAPEAIDWSRTPPGWRAVYAAALAADDQTEAAQQIASTIPVEKLKKEERELLPE